MFLINLNDYSATMNKIINDMKKSEAETKMKVNNFNSNQFFGQIQSQLKEYPGKFYLQQALFSKDNTKIYSAVHHLYKWIQSLDNEYQRNFRNVANAIYTYTDYLDKDSPEFDYNTHLQELIQQTQINMNNISEFLKECVSRISNWNNSSLMISANAPESEYGYVLEPATDAIIYFGNEEEGPYFSLWHENKWVVEDVLEAGDEDFFTNPGTQSDYFKLINEIRNPGSSQKGKVMTLYTARPMKDRQLYFDAKTIPSNIFLSNDYNHVEGLASDLSSRGSRDIWKIRLNSKYLTQTLDGPIKYFQVTGEKTPIISIELIAAGTQ